MRRTSLFLFACLATVSLPALAASSPWDGTWKLDRAHSQFTGETYSYTSAGDGRLEYSNGADMKFSFPTNGTEAPGPFAGTTIIWKQLSATKAEYLVSVNGKRVNRILLTLSPDGTTLLSERTSYRPDGTTTTGTSTATRTAGSHGFEGTWKVSEIKSSAPDVFQASSPAENTLSMIFPAWKESWQGKLDGTDAPLTGPDVVHGVTIALKATGDHALTGTSKIDGKTVGFETDTLSPDGKTWTITSWDAGKENEKTVAVYTRQ